MIVARWVQVDFVWPTSNYPHFLKLPEHLNKALPVLNPSHKLQFFLPESDDLVDPDFNFLADAYGPGRNAPSTDIYAHQIFPEPNFDGVLVTKSGIKPKKEAAILQAGGIQQFLRLPNDTPVMGDCGAFQFVAEDDPPYASEELCDYYVRLGFDFGITLDHLILEFDPSYDEGHSLFRAEPTEKMQHRYRISIDNAKEMLRLVRNKNLSFTPVGSVQGWSPDSYHAAATELIEAGFDYIALGGLARASNNDIIPTLQRLTPLFKESGVRVHFLGVARHNILDVFMESGITSCDSASTILQAFKSNKDNYHTAGKAYTAIRIPAVKGDASPKVRKLLQSFSVHGDREGFEKRENELHELEQKALLAIREYAARKVDLSEAMKHLTLYEDQFADEKKYYPLFEETLRDRPWEQCPCTICQQIGVDVVILRGNNRNRRRGFHNTHVFYQQFKDYVAI
jgi:hypothetical protein